MSENKVNVKEDKDEEAEKDVLHSVKVEANKNHEGSDKVKESNNKNSVQEDKNNEADREVLNCKKIEGNNDQDITPMKSESIVEVNVSEIENKIITQIEYYFGDFNLKKDKFLCDQMILDNGWIPLDVLLKFNRLAAITKDKELIVSSLKKSKNDIVQVSEDNTKIRRNPDMPPVKEENEEQRKIRQDKSVYIKGFPLTSSLVDILNFLAIYGKVDHVKMRKYEDKASKKWMFKGSVFVIFPTKEAAEAFLQLEDLKYEEKELLKLPFREYHENKKKERFQQKYDKKLKKFSDISRLSKGSLLHFKGIPSETNVMDIRKQLEDSSWPIEFIDYQPGAIEANIRLKGEGTATSVLETLGDEKVVKISDVPVSVNLISGDEEINILRRMEMERHDKLKSRKGNRGKKRPLEGDRNGGRNFKRNKS